jgi:[acyl-carrier-protein] S-malonyltransferase
MRLVSLRGRLMAEIQAERPGTMAAIIGPSAETVSELCDRAAEAGVVGLANLNTPTQTVISGEEAGVVRAMELADEASARKTVRLPVGGAFHSRLMEPVQAALAQAAEGLSWSDPRVPLVANHSGEAATSADEVRQALVAQIAAPVRWADCVQTLVEEGCDRSIELGPGKVLSGLVKKIDPDVETVSGDSRRALDGVPSVKEGGP